MHPGTRVSLKGPANVVRNNRLWHKFDEYQFLFRENLAGSTNLTKAVRRALGPKRVAPPEDVAFGACFDLLQDKVYDRKKKEAKQRDCFLSHYSPVCRTFSCAQAQYNQRTMERPYGDPELKGPIRDTVIQDSKLAVRCAQLCKIHHQVGDAFSLEHVFPTPMLQFESFKELLAMPGVFLFTWDNCRFGKRYRHRQVLVTNLPWYLGSL